MDPCEGATLTERRKEPRKNLMSYSQVFDLYGGSLLGYLADMNLHGAMVIGQKPLQENNTITLQVEVPDLEGVSVKRLTLPARIVWCESDVSPAFFNTGFEFRELTPEQAGVIQAIMDAYEFQRKLPDYPFRASTKSK
jgi:hypothetical protein